jgi:hypothetical protein
MAPSYRTKLKRTDPFLFPRLYHGWEVTRYEMTPSEVHAAIRRNLKRLVSH